MTRYSDFVKSHMKKLGKSWSCSVCEIQKGDLYNKHKINISRENRQMGMEDRDAPAPKKITFKIKVNRRAPFERRERSMMGMEDMDAPSQVKTLELSPIPPPEPLVPANPNTKTAPSLLSQLSVPTNYDDENPNNEFRYEIMLALTYLVPKRLSANDSEDKKTHGVYGRDDDGNLIRMTEVKQATVARLKEAYGKPFTGRDATRIADEIVKSGEKSHRIKVMIKYMNDHLDIGLPDEVTPDWKFRHLKSYGNSESWSFKSDKTERNRHTNIFRTIDIILDSKEYGSGYDVGLPEEEEGPLSPLHVKKTFDDRPDAKLYKLREELRELLNKSRSKKNKETIVTLNDESSTIVKPILKAELESGYYTSGFTGTQVGDGDPSRITFELNGIDVVFRDEDGEIIPTLGNSKRATFLNTDDPVIQLHNALKRNYIWRGYGGKNGRVILNVLKEPEYDKPSEEFRELVSNVFR